MKLIVGLGNPGKEYSGSRHNVGFRCVTHLAKLHGIAFNRQQCRAKVGVGTIEGVDVVLAKPRTFMNASGESVRLLVQRFKVPLEDILIIHDDMDLPVGKIRLRERGSSGGHRGIESIISCLGSQDFPRIRIGVGRPAGEEDDEVINHVLGAFSSQERSIIDEVVPKVAEAVRCVLTEGLAAAMNKYN
jgi:PTH1 family peptidyl-tRNA hydrolase